MSRSHRNSPVLPVSCAKSDRFFKTHAHRKWRRRLRQQVAACDDWDRFVPVDIREVSDIYHSAKDGKTYYTREHFNRCADRYGLEWAMKTIWGK